MKGQKRAGGTDGSGVTLQATCLLPCFLLQLSALKVPPQVKPCGTDSMFTHLDSAEASFTHTHTHTEHLSAEIIHFFLLVVMCLDCFNPVPQVCIHLLAPSLAVDWVSAVLLLLTVQQDGRRATGVSL